MKDQNMKLPFTFLFPAQQNLLTSNLPQKVCTLSVELSLVPIFPFIVKKNYPVTSDELFCSFVFIGLLLKQENYVLTSVNL